MCIDDLDQNIGKWTCVGESNHDKLQGEMLNIWHTSAQQIVAKSQLVLMHKNITIIKTIILHLLKFGPNTIMLIISNLVNAFNFVSKNLFRFLHN
jgi:malate/lactate dehydrogenase